MAIFCMPKGLSLSLRILVMLPLPASKTTKPMVNKWAAFPPSQRSNNWLFTSLLSRLGLGWGGLNIYPINTGANCKKEAALVCLASAYAFKALFFAPVYFCWPLHSFCLHHSSPHAGPSWKGFGAQPGHLLSKRQNK